MADQPPQYAIDAAEEFNRRFSSDSAVEVCGSSGATIEIALSGNACSSCCLYDYVGDLILLLEARSECPHAIWRLDQPSPAEPRCRATIARLGFLSEIARAAAAVGGMVDARRREFESVRGSEDAVFSELCFCILTANYTAEGGIRMQRALSRDFPAARREELAAKLKAMGHRFPNKRAEFISEAQRLRGTLCSMLQRFANGPDAREWLVENVKGFGYKEASHFLRNVGFRDVAIIDRHILSYLAANGLVDPKRALTRRRYLEIELLLSAIAAKLGTTQAELDLYIWYLKTGKVLK